jgi:oxygen-independent coproporphyrinogen-3 oxidase
MTRSDFQLEYPTDQAPAGIYVHVPFCLSRCNYCAFVSNPYDPDYAAGYPDLLIREMELFTETHGPGRHKQGSGVDTIYFGGGTPSLLEPAAIVKLIDACKRLFQVADAPEVTLEINPGTLKPADLGFLRDNGLNRVSLGMQSLNDVELSRMGRRHTASQAVQAFRELRSAGFESISVDLIVGFPGQTRESFRENLRRTLELQPDHLSAYLLEVKADSPLEGMIRSRAIDNPDDDLLADLYDDLCSLTAVAGLEHYEISNFALPGHESRHNLKYWQDAVFFGFGPGAHGMTGTHRYANEEDPARYEQALRDGRLPRAWFDPLAAFTRFRDALIMGLRLVRGVDLAVLGRRYRFDARAFVQATIGDLADAGLFVLTGDRLALTHQGRLLSNIVFSRWV